MNVAYLPRFFAVFAAGIAPLAADFLEPEFAAPPVASRASAFWCWLNGSMTKEYITGSKVLAGYGLHLAAEAGGPGTPIWNTCPVDAITGLGAVDVPRSEFWMGNPRHIFLIKEIALKHRRVPPRMAPCQRPIHHL